MNKKNRHGKHAENLVGVAGYVTPELKAIAQVTANALHVTMMELMRQGITYHATRVGVMQNGVVSSKWQDRVNAYVDTYNTRKATRKSTKSE